jgi:CDP-glycerol glycerophosphotransferase
MRELLKKLSPQPLIEMYKAMRFGFITLLFYLFRLIPIKKNRIVLMNVWGFGDNVKYVTEELVARKLPYELIFICNHPVRSEVPNSVQLLKTNTFAAIKALATAQIWVESNRKEAYIRKRKKQYYIQLWHGGLALKKIEGDCADYLGETYIKRAKKDSSMTDLYVSNGSFCTNMYRRAFWFEGKIAEYGSPRMDLLLQEDNVKKRKTKTALNIPFFTRVAIYAPTYRDSKDVSVYQMNYEKLRESLTEKFGGKWCILVRLHPLIANISQKLTFSENVIDASRYKDMYELMQASDILITDYSNTMFEFALMKRPVFLFAKDLVTYQSERGFYFDYSILPFPIASTEQKLIQDIFDYAPLEEGKRVGEFLRTTGVKEDGNASKRVADHIIKLCGFI